MFSYLATEWRVSGLHTRLGVSPARTAFPVIRRILRRSELGDSGLPERLRAYSYYYVPGICLQCSWYMAVIFLVYSWYMPVIFLAYGCYFHTIFLGVPCFDRRFLLKGGRGARGPVGAGLGLLGSIKLPALSAENRPEGLSSCCMPG